MTNPELQELTASEPLTYEEEVEMQSESPRLSIRALVYPRIPHALLYATGKWREDEDKLTFIVLGRPLASGTLEDMRIEDIPKLPMIGDVNLFFNRSVDEGEKEILEVECEVMIAEPAYRGKGLGYESLSLLLAYASSPIPDGLAVPKSSFVAKVGLENHASRALFRKLGFKETKVVEVFKEVELKYNRAGNADWLPGEKRFYD